MNGFSLASIYWTMQLVTAAADISCHVEAVFHINIRFVKHKGSPALAPRKQIYVFGHKDDQACSMGHVHMGQCPNFVGVAPASVKTPGTVTSSMPHINHLIVIEQASNTSIKWPLLGLPGSSQREAALLSVMCLH